VSKGTKLIFEGETAAILRPVPKPKPRKKVRRPTGRPRTRLKKNGPRTKKSGGHLFPENVDEQYREWMRRQRCIVDTVARNLSADDPRAAYPPQHFGGLCQKPMCVLHVRGHGAGGKDLGNLLPACWRHNDWQTVIGIKTFAAKLGINLERAARRYTTEYEAELWPCP